MEHVLVVSFLVLLLGAVIYDVLSHRLPNYLIVVGLLVAFFVQTFTSGQDGLISALAGLLTGFLCFIPFYFFGGMAAGDVKLMAVLGAFLGGVGAFWAAAFSLIAGGVLGVLYLFVKGGLGKFLVRYWAMAMLRTHIPAEADDVSRHRFPYALAIASGALFSLLWGPIR